MEAFISTFMPSTGDAGLLFWAKRLLVAMLVFAIFWVFSQVVCYIVNRWGSKIASFTATDLDDRILKRVTPSISLLLTFIGIYLALRTLPLHEKFFRLLSGSFFVANIVIICILAYRVLHETLLWYGERDPSPQGSTFARQMAPMVEKITMLFIIGSALIVVLKHFNYDILSLVTALGIGSLAIGMAAKDTLAHMISGFTLMLDRPFRIGDRIQLANGQAGDVTDIGLRSTKIKTAENMLLIIPNSDLCNTTVINQAFPDVRAKGRINIGVAYGSDVERVKELLVATALEVPTVLREPAPEAFFTSFGDSALQMALFFWVEDYTKVFPVTDTINTLLSRRLAEQGVAIPYPTQTVLLHKEG